MGNIANDYIEYAKGHAQAPMAMKKPGFRASDAQSLVRAALATDSKLAIGAIGAFAEEAVRLSNASRSGEANFALGVAGMDGLFDRGGQVGGEYEKATAMAIICAAKASGLVVNGEAYCPSEFKQSLAEGLSSSQYFTDDLRMRLVDFLSDARGHAPISLSLVLGPEFDAESFFECREALALKRDMTQTLPSAPRSGPKSI